MKIISLVVFTLLFIRHAPAQTYTRTDVTSIGIHPITQHGRVTGYFSLSASTKTRRGRTLTILDGNLREIMSVGIAVPKNSQVMSFAYNGTNFGMALSNIQMKGDKIDFIAYDNSLKETGSKARVIGLGGQIKAKRLVPVPRKGFLMYGIVEGNNNHYEMEFLDNQMRTDWTDAGPGKLTLVFQDSTAIGSLIRRTDSVSYKDLEYDFQVQHIETGKKLFRVPLIIDDQPITVLKVRHDPVTGESTVLGEYYRQEANELRDRSLGFINLVYDSLGNLKQQKTLSWEDISKIAPVNQDGKFLENQSNVMFHQVLWSTDGDIFLIGEQYKKIVSVKGALGGAATTVLSTWTRPSYRGPKPSVGMTRLDIFDLAVFHINADFTLKEVKTFHKKQRTVMMQPGMTFKSPKFAGYFAEGEGLFDYDFTQASDVSSGFTIIYDHYNGNWDGNNLGFLVGSITYTPEKQFVANNFAISRSVKTFRVANAKPGYVLAEEYFPSKRRFEARLVEIKH